MPSAHPRDDDDPVIASYDIFITEPLLREIEVGAQQQHSSRLFVLQYPSHRALNKPYNAARGQKPTRCRLKTQTGMIEVDVPLLTQEHFNPRAGEKYGQSMGESRVLQAGGSHGLGGGFASGPAVPNFSNLHDIPEHDRQADHLLGTQTLGGKVAKATERDPIYMLGSFQNDELHLTHLDALVQLRPQLHHIDAEEEVNQRKVEKFGGSSAKAKAGLEGPAVKLESKAIEIKMKDTKEDPKDRNLNLNAKLLRDIQADQWISHEWIDEADSDAIHRAGTYTTLSSDPKKLKQLHSMVYNDDWLDKMSVPREDGKKGLRAKLKGRDRERARRKKVEYERRQLNADSSAAITRAEISSDSDVSSLGDNSDIEMVNRTTDIGKVDIKQEPGSLVVAPAVEPPVSTAAKTQNVSKKRGRPKKT